MVEKLEARVQSLEEEVSELRRCLAEIVLNWYYYDQDHGAHYIMRQHYSEMLEQMESPQAEGT